MLRLDLGRGVILMMMMMMMGRMMTRYRMMMRMMMRLCRLGLRRLDARLRLRRGQERGKRWRRFGIRSGGPGRRGVGGISWNEMAEGEWVPRRAR